MQTPHTAPRGSIPALVMRTGLIRPVNVDRAREDIDTSRIENLVAYETNRLPPVLPSAAPTITPVPPLPSPTTTAVAQTAVATPPMPIPNAPVEAPPPAGSDRHYWHRLHRPHAMVREIQKLHPNANIHGAAEPQLGADASGRPVVKFKIAASPAAGGAESMAHGLRNAARSLYRSGLHALPPELVGGPLAALMRGGAVELHFQNGVVVKATP